MAANNDKIVHRSSLMKMSGLSACVELISLCRNLLSLSICLHNYRSSAAFTCKNACVYEDGFMFKCSDCLGKRKRRLNAN